MAGWGRGGGRWSPPRLFIHVGYDLSEGTSLFRTPGLFSCAGKTLACTHGVFKIHCGHESGWLITKRTRMVFWGASAEAGQKREEGMLWKGEEVLLFLHSSVSASTSTSTPFSKSGVRACVRAWQVLCHWTTCFLLNISSLPVCIEQACSLHYPQAIVCVCMCGSVWVFWFPMFCKRPH